jgi:hypothetical protein
VVAKKRVVIAIETGFVFDKKAKKPVEIAAGLVFRENFGERRVRVLSKNDTSCVCENVDTGRRSTISVRTLRNRFTVTMRMR